MRLSNYCLIIRLRNIFIDLCLYAVYKKNDIGIKNNISNVLVIPKRISAKKGMEIVVMNNCIVFFGVCFCSVKCFVFH